MAPGGSRRSVHGEAVRRRPIAGNPLAGGGWHNRGIGCGRPARGRATSGRERKKADCSGVSPAILRRGAALVAWIRPDGRPCRGSGAAMPYRDREVRRRHQVSAAHRKRVRRIRMTLLTVFLVFYVVVLSVVLFGWPVDQMPITSQRALAVSFDKLRHPLTRSAVVEIGAAGVGDPADLAVWVKRDPHHAGGQFPADQVILTAIPLVGNSVLVTATVDPWVPERVDSGLYEETLVLSAGGNWTEIPLIIGLGKRSGWWAVTAFFIIATGAALGLTVKWITERLTPQAALMRRFDALRRTMGWGADGRDLPLSARLRLNELEDYILRQDLSRAERAFSQLDPLRNDAAVLASQTAVLYDQLDSLSDAIERCRGTLSHDDRALADAAVDEAHRTLVEAQSLPWPKQTAEIRTALGTIRDDLVLAGHVIGSFLRSPANKKLREAIRYLQRGRSAAARRAYALRDTAETEVPLPGASGKEASPPPREAEPAWLDDLAPVPVFFRYARTFAGAASVAVVSLVGLKTQYLDNPGFDSNLSSWVMLGLWGLVVELSGVAVVDVLARLGSSAAAATARQAI
ncbi:hypothetical protein [Actinoplanes sp. NPDC023714]|uniref:hypothetical protein n=1 Tax=Actinoplanes sp. NPDC023714 TaxID=3154322 RepID=UPI0033E81511